MLPQTHIATAYQFLNAAENYSVTDAPLIKSEMLWCAAAHCAKAAANQYGWANVSHNDLFRVVRRLERILSSSTIKGEFNTASRLHRNMYEGQMNARQVARAEAVVRRFVSRMADILRDYPQAPKP